MKKQVLFFVLFTTMWASALVAQIVVRPSGNITKETHQVVDFTGVDISTDFKAFITFGSPVSVQIESDDNIHKHIKVAVEGGTLVVRQIGPINVKGRETLIAYITVPSLNAIKGSGDAILQFRNELKTDELVIELSGDSRLDGALSVGKMDVEVRGDSFLTLSGTANRVNAQVRGDSHFKDYDFAIGELVLRLSGDSLAKLTVRDNMDIDISGDSVMKYKGTPRIESQRVRGDSELAKVD